MIPFTIFNPLDGSVLSHKWASHADAVVASIPRGASALIGKHVPFEEVVSDSVDFVVSADPETPDYSSPSIDRDPPVGVP